MQSAPRAGVDEDVAVKKKKVRRKAARYVEGESESDENMSVGGEDGEDDEDDEGSVEDVGFGSEEDDDDDEEEEDDESGEEESDDEDGPKLNGFIDDEAEEDYSEDEESSAEE